MGDSGRGGGVGGEWVWVGVRWVGLGWVGLGWVGVETVVSI